jgi:hypothetical protein
MNSEQIAEVCYNVNKAYSEGMGIQVPAWKSISKEKKLSYIIGVEFSINNPTVTPELQHSKWMEHMVNNGWQYGPSKNEKTKQHPSIAKYNRLPKLEQIKDALFITVVRTLTKVVQNGSLLEPKKEVSTIEKPVKKTASKKKTE